MHHILEYSKKNVGLYLNFNIHQHPPKKNKIRNCWWRSQEIVGGRKKCWTLKCKMESIAPNILFYFRWTVNAEKFAQMARKGGVVQC